MNDSTPCQDLATFKKLIMWVTGLQTTMLVITLGMTVNIADKNAENNARMIEFATNQQNLELKVENATEKATSALAISSKAESNIAWIREGLTELKLAVREINKRNP